MIILLILLVIWFSYSALEGSREGYYFFLWKNASPFDVADIKKSIKNIHVLFTMQRCCMAIGLVLAYHFYLGGFNLYELTILGLSASG